MAVRYVRKSGSNANNGTTPALAWLTLAKALGASGLASGDVLYVGAGTYRETVTAAMTSAVAETKIIGDVDGSQTGDAGEVVWTAYTTNDTTAVAGLPTLNLSGRDFLTFQDLTFVGGAANGSCVLSSTSVATNITFRRCIFNGIAGSNSDIISYTGAANTAAHWLIDSCIVVGWGIGVSLFGPLSASADYDLDFVVLNCLVQNAGPYTGVVLATTGTGSFKPGGLIVRNCTVISGGSGVAITLSTSTSIPSQTVNCVLFGPTKSISAATLGSMTEDYNMLVGAGRQNVTAGTHSQTVYAPALELGQSQLHGLAPRPWLSPMSGSPALGFGDDGTAPSVDGINRPRPAGGNSTSKGIGWTEFHDSAVKETGTTDAGSVAINITGPGDHDFRIPVDATSTTISVKARYDSTHAATNKPQAILLDAPEIGVTTQTLTMSAAVDTWETLTFAAITPTAKGVVIVRLVSRSAAAGGKAFFDTFSVA